MKKQITIPVGKIMSVVAIGEGTCAAVLVDKALKAVPMHPVVKYIGRSVVSNLIMAPFAAGSVYMWLSDELNLKIGGKEKEEIEEEESKFDTELTDEELIMKLDNTSDELLDVIGVKESISMLAAISRAVDEGRMSHADGLDRLNRLVKTFGDDYKSFESTGKRPSTEPEETAAPVDEEVKEEVKEEAKSNNTDDMEIPKSEEV